MTRLFLTIINMSLQASYVILIVMMIRLLIKKAPKVISYALWSVAAFRLAIPFSLESIFSLLPRNINTAPIPKDIIYQERPRINSGIEVVDTLVSGILPLQNVGDSGNPMQIYTQIGAYIWITGIIVLLIYSLLSILRLKRQLRNAQLIEGNSYEARNLKTPFVLGIIRPNIYLPVGLTAEEKRYILHHEQTHISRHDYIVKPFAFLLLSIHWFNPLVWIAFILMGMDMELSCDERVLKDMDASMKKPYATSILSLATGSRILNGSPLAFGEGNVKGRIKNVLNYKRPQFWVIIITITIVTALGIGLITNPKAKPSLKPTVPEWSPEQSIDMVGMAELDYATDEFIIFHGYFGLFVYDLESQQFIRSLDLKPLNCAAIQGDDYCDVTVSKDGNTVQLHRMSSGNMYVYDVSSNTLQETPYEPMNDRFGSSFIPIEDVVATKNLGNYSYNAVIFGQDEFGYLYTSDYTLGTLSYVRGDMVYMLFEHKEPTDLPASSIVTKEGKGNTEEDSNLNSADTLTAFTEEEVAAARAVVEEYFRSIEAKDDEAILKTLTPGYNRPNVVLYGEETRTLTSIEYSEDDPMRKSYIDYGRGDMNGTELENVIVFRVSFQVKYPKGASGSFNEGEYTNWSMILIRDSKDASWLIDDQGY